MAKANAEIAERGSSREGERVQVIHAVMASAKEILVAMVNARATAHVMENAKATAPAASAVMAKRQGSGGS